MAGAAGGPNLLQNPGFDTGISGWSTQDPDGTVSWDPIHDSFGDPSSGSLTIGALSTSGIPVAATQCVAVTGGEDYVLVADATITAGNPFERFAYLGLFFYPSGDCSGEPAGGGAASNGHQLPANVWAIQSLEVSAPPPARSAHIQLLALDSAVGTLSWEAAFDNVFFGLAVPSGGCVDTPTAMCLADSRFRVEATWRTPNGDSGQAQAVRMTPDTGDLWFFNASNVEAIVKVRNACVPPFNRFWVFTSGLTNVEVDLTVTDTATGAVWTNQTIQGQTYPTVLDTDAFDTCPI